MGIVPMPARERNLPPEAFAPPSILHCISADASGITTGHSFENLLSAGQRAVWSRVDAMHGEPREGRDSEEEVEARVYI